MPSNHYTSEVIQSISSDELEFRDYVSHQFTVPVANNHREQEKQSHVYKCPCGYSLPVGKSKHIQGPIFYDNTGAAVDRCPKCDRVLGGEAKVS